MEGLTNEFHRTAGRVRRFLTNDRRIKGSPVAARLISIITWFEAAQEVAKIDCACQDCRYAAFLAQVQAQVAQVWIASVAQALPLGSEEVDRADAG